MLIYLASPYSHEDPDVVEDRYQRVLKFTARLISYGFIVYSPIVHSHHVAKYLPPHVDKLRFSFWEKLDTKMISRCDQLWILTLDGWKESVGIKAEMKFAESLSIQIKIVEENQANFLMGI